MLGVHRSMRQARAHFLTCPGGVLLVTASRLAYPEVQARMYLAIANKVPPNRCDRGASRVYDIKNSACLVDISVT